MKITKFLRKRITKDEKQARKAIKERERRDYVNPAGALAPEHTLQSWPDFGVPAMRVGPERVLAECAAKRPNHRGVRGLLRGRARRWQARNFRRHPRTQCPVGTRRGVRTPSRLRPRLD